MLVGSGTRPRHATEAKNSLAGRVACAGESPGHEGAALGSRVGRFSSSGGLGIAFGS